MMEKENSNRTRIVGVRLTPDEFKLIEGRYKATNCRKLSDYIRQCVFQRPVVKTYRDKSLDDFMAEMIVLRSELNRIANNYNQSVKKLHTLSTIADFRTWLLAYDIEKHTLFNKMEEIKTTIQKFAERWLL